MDLYEKYGLTRIINACGKLTRLSNARVLPGIKAEIAQSLDLFFDADELMGVASEKIAAFTGAEAGFVTACSAAGLTLATAACMTGKDLDRISRLPDVTGLNSEVLIQKGHTVDFGAPITQVIRLAGAHVREIGSVTGTSAELLESAFTAQTAALVFVVSHHTIRYGCVPLRQAVSIAHQKGVPVIVDAAAQSFNLKKIVAAGADIVVCSGHKYLSGTVSGLVCGKKSLLEAMALQNRGIGRTMKVGKEGIFGLMAAIECREQLDEEHFNREVANRVSQVCRELSDLPGVRAEQTEDPNGNPFCRARIWIDPRQACCDARQVCKRAADATPSIRLRDHHVDEGYFDLDVIELTEAEQAIVLDRLRQMIQPADDQNRKTPAQAADARFAWL